MTIKLSPFDPADYLEDESDMAAYLADCARDGDPALIAQNLSQLARDTGMTRAGLSRALSSKGDPSFRTVSKVAKALGLKVSISAANAKPSHSVSNTGRRARTMDRV